MSIEVSPRMRNNDLVLGLEERLGDNLIFTARVLPKGYLFRADSQGEGGFSLKAKLPEPLKEVRPVLWIQGYRSEPVGSHPRCTLQEYFGCRSAVDNYVTFLESVGRPGTDLTNAESGRRINIGHYSLLSDDPAVMAELVDHLLGLVECS